MSKVRTFSRTFLKGHIRSGEPTLFVEKTLTGLDVNYRSDWFLQRLLVLNTINIGKGKLSFKDIEDFWRSLQEVDETKFHTIRKGFSIKQGEKISPRTWSGKPYDSPQIIFWHDLEVKTTQEFYRDHSGNWLVDKQVLSGLERLTISMGDGLRYADMVSWFDREFHGQIISWTENCIYGQ